MVELYPPVMSASPKMHITILAAGDHSPGFAWVREFESVKPAVLSTDRVPVV